MYRGPSFILGEHGRPGNDPNSIVCCNTAKTLQPYLLKYHDQATRRCIVDFGIHKFYIIEKSSTHDCSLQAAQVEREFSQVPLFWTLP